MFKHLIFIVEKSRKQRTVSGIDKITRGLFPDSHLHRGSYISARFIEFIIRVGGKVLKGEASRALYHFFATRLMHSIVQGHEC